MGARPFFGLVGAVWCCFSRLCEPTAGRSWPHAGLKNVIKINACKNAGESGGARGRGVEKVVIVAARTRKKIPRHTGYAKQQPGSLFNFILSWGTCTHAWLARKRSRWRGGPEAACETANGLQKVPAWPPRGERSDPQAPRAWARARGCEKEAIIYSKVLQMRDGCPTLFLG
jgi:hypothetical protein